MVRGGRFCDVSAVVIASALRESALSESGRTGGATLKEVALAAGVSVAAVSKVLHGTGKSIRVSEARAVEIRAVAERLRYRPNVLARSLRMSKTHTIGLIWENMSDIGEGPQYYVQLLDGVANEAFKHHYRLMILPEIPHCDTIRSLDDGRLDGVIWCKMPDTPEIAADIARAQMKVVGLNAPPPVFHACPTISCDNEHGSELVVDHLTSLGHRHIAFVMDRGSVDTPDAVARLAGFQAAMEARGLSPDVLIWDKESPEVLDWWSTEPPHTALYAWYEGLAGTILSRCVSAGIRVPDELSIVGFDSTLYCDSLSPRLTAVAQPIKKMALAATRLLLSLIADEPVANWQHVYPCSLDVRESTFSVRRADIR